jgi:hypothetical protein
MVGAGDETLTTGYDVKISFFNCFRRYGRIVAAGIRLGQRKRGKGVAGGDAQQPLFLRILTCECFLGIKPLLDSVLVEKYHS